jgi:transposase-like protein
MMRRGPQTPVLITIDGAPGLIRAVQEVFAHSLLQRCLAHKTPNIIDKMPDMAAAEVKAAIRAAYYAPNREVADMIAADVRKTYQASCPSAMSSFRDDWEAYVAYLRCPAIHHKRFRPPICWSAAFWKSVGAPERFLDSAAKRAVSSSSLLRCCELATAGWASR